MLTSCIRFMAEGCAATPVLGVLEEREAAAPVRVEGLREEAARLAEVLEAGEIAVELGLGTTPAKAAVRSRARRLAGRGWLLLEASGMFSAG
ncbi:hypothetical protein OH768_27990 [Streptomyces sp. NBC_01622]|jgi:hypothetical protein|uniref:hypothetical protein n=1 Tax=unclassified Streptomyces TaxID=2593676 RepID=UPI00224EAB14|nr:hypothetical protein [Streptomyces sp. NBC_00183]MCX5286486.1 hypothetical protein [Streptomyces sp. NBC_00183]WTE43930.1 hypothetical protein OH768_27990 [Streptomyces sp. NBC_01622]